MLLLFTDLVEVWRTSEVVESAYTSRPDWDKAVKVWEGLGSVQSDKSFESYTPARDVSQERLRVYLPIDADVTDTDRLRIGGHWYEVEGAPQRRTQTSCRHVRLSAWRSLR